MQSEIEKHGSELRDGNNEKTRSVQGCCYLVSHQIFANRHHREKMMPKVMQCPRAAIVMSEDVIGRTDVGLTEL